MAGVVDLDLYGILDVSPDATEKEIVKAYRKRALKCHPDKNPDNPKAVELFHQLSKALEVLTDKAAKAAYDKIQQAKKATELRNRALDSKRKKLKEDLERRENAAQSFQVQNQKAKRNFQAEVERLRKEGSSLLEQEQKRLAEELAQEKMAKSAASFESGHSARLKVKWSAKKGDLDNGGYNTDLLHKLFDKYGDVTALIVSTKRNGSAIIEFASYPDAKMACDNEVGLTDNPLKVTILPGSGQVQETQETDLQDGQPQASTASRLHSGTSTSSTSRDTSEAIFSHKSALSSDTDFESVVLMRMRQAEERKRLCEELAKEDDIS